MMRKPFFKRKHKNAKSKVNYKNIWLEEEDDFPIELNYAISPLTLGNCLNKIAEMIHPKTRLRYINDVMGYGLFATAFIPKGTIIYVKELLEIGISPEDYERYRPELQEQIEKYSYTNENGTRILRWDFVKYVNHCCHSNTLSSAYGFDVAIRDIEKGGRNHLRLWGLKRRTGNATVL